MIRGVEVRDVARQLGLSRSKIALIAGAALLGGFAEAAVLAVITFAATTLTEGSGSVPLEANGLSLADLSVPVLLGIALGLVAVRLVLIEVVAYLPARMNADLQLSVRDEIWASFLEASWSVQSRDREGGLQNLLTNQVTQATQAVLTATTGIAAGITFVALLLSALLIDVVVAGVAVVVGALLFVALRPLTRLARRYTRDLALATDDYGSNISESVRLVEQIQVFDARDEVIRRAHDLAQRMRASALRAQLLGRNIAPLYQTVALVVIIGGLGALYVSDSTEVAALGAVVLILVRALSYGQATQSAYHAVNESAPFLEILQSSRERYAASRATDGPHAIDGAGRLEFRNVSFTYGGYDAVTDIDFSIDRGESIGLVGPSGAGKSTIVQLVLRLRAPSRGEILVDGLPIESITRRDWVRLFSYVPQDPQLLSGTVRENIRFHRPWVTDVAIEDAARRAHMHSEILRFEQGYETVVGQRADAVSGGQRQRICVARALAGAPGFLVLDEPTSALDARSEEGLRQTLAELRGSVTVLVIAHRLSTLNVCDRIMVLADGHLEAVGSASDLARENAFFRDAVALSRVTGRDDRS